MTQQQSIPDLYKSTTHSCPYLKDREAANLLVDPRFEVTPPLYDNLIRSGFRRNGKLYYRPHCPACMACRSVRIPVKNFTPNRSQKRTVVKNDDVRYDFRSPSYSDEHFWLYRKYQAIRHSGDSMDDSDPEKYQQFLVQSNIDTFLIEMRIRRRLVGVSVVDHVANGLSAVYTFFDPIEERRSLGTLAILNQIELARQIDYEFLYLGYWIADCSKMRYKENFSPLEAFDTEIGEWCNIA
ncbi:MAG: arginyltransferase [Acidiferrobacteraceae bacterium]|mgnify:CR=1 FL=1|nr:arginyltransferase [Acidiferrobacteraceae bacterium]|tara:strand:- start:193 stop:909 length:717 start_codon:yes stop_codon:yes gene_type:complete